KTAYDRLGRITDEYRIAKDTDAGVYADALTLTSNDIVVEQHETRYSAAKGTVVMRIAISRLYNDIGASENKGKLDLDADGGTPDPLKLTAADDKGRPQITAFW